MSTPSLASDAPSDGLVIRLFGGFRVWQSGQEIPDQAWRLRKAKNLVKLIALSPDHRLHREQAMEFLWQDTAPDIAAHNLHQAVYVARRALASNNHDRARFLLLEDDVYVLSADARVAIDVEQFQLAAKNARAKHKTSDYSTALALYTGDLLPEDLYEEWTVAARDTLKQTHLVLLLELARLYREQEDYPNSIETLRRLVSADPANEEAQRELMWLYTASGQRQQAVRQYQLLREALRREVDARPDAASERLYQEILAGHIGEQSTPAPALTLSSRPELRGSPPVKTEHELPHTNLPAALSKFIGRENEIAEVTRLLGTTRLLTLTGSGGCGKTRLAFEAAHGIQSKYPDGVWRVELGSLADPALVLPAMAVALMVTEQAGVPLGQTLKSFLRTKRLLLILDNCEHLVTVCAQIVETLLGSCPEVRIIVTSREPLHVSGELTWRVPSLTAPDPRDPRQLEHLQDFDAVQLFIERAHVVAPGFELSPQNQRAVAQICFRLDGIPLAIELAAARLNTLTAEEIAAHLDDRFRLLTRNDRNVLPRHRTLRATMDWSYDLLAPKEQALWARLSVFAGDFTLNAAEGVCADTESKGDLREPDAAPLRPASLGTTNTPITREEILDLLAKLVDCSIVIAEIYAPTSTYQLLETVREYGKEKMKAANEWERWHSRHRNYFMQFAMQASTEIQAAGQFQWLARLNEAHDNFRAALEWSRREENDEAFAVMASSLWSFWYIRGYLSEGRRWLEAALKVRRHTSLLAQAAVLGGAAVLAMEQGDYASASLYANECVALATPLDQKVTIATGKLVTGAVALRQGDFTRATRSHQDALELLRAARNIFGVALALHLLGVDAQYQGDLATARLHFESSLSYRRKIGDQWGMAQSLHNLGSIAQMDGDYARAREFEEESLALSRRLASRIGILSSLDNLGMIATAQGDVVRANQLLVEAMELAQDLDAKPEEAHVLWNLGRVALAQGDLSGARALLRGSLALRHEMSDKQDIPETLEALGELAVAQNKTWRAATLLGAAEAARREIGVPMYKSEYERHTQILAKLTAQLSAEAFKASWLRGEGLGLDESIEYGLANDNE